MISHDQIKLDINYCRHNKATYLSKGLNDDLNKAQTTQYYQRNKCTEHPYWNHHSKNAFVGYKFLVSEMKINS